MTPTELTERSIRKLLADLDPDLATLDRIAEVSLSHLKAHIEATLKALDSTDED